MTTRRTLLLATLAAPLAARAHHGWSSFDQDRPVFVQGRVVAVRWQNPHAELELELPPDYRLPADVASREVPAQAAPVDGRVLLGRAVAPARKDRRWTIELAPLTRLDAWRVAPVKVGATVGVLGYTLQGEKEPVVRAEYLYVDGRAYGLRSSPAS
ncbi:hypothetical protein H8N03_20850 [Ramlibacter sp. USB13]|uniref:DUF4198 domain-containing protein n=1 Tax=Ramlibacter cellulosilyticus TaxID=2764187 RepID=A0A923SD01_9BURK|nr:DUF6152 family protein [Ramlibacter cellulosilyticus]MBC5785409.1 hypothetical protein [Ramlibacter cellulosilyticus]